MIGPKTEIVVRVEAVIAPCTSSAPLAAASRIGIPPSRCRKMFSRTMMELSTSIPTPRASPPRLMMLRGDAERLHEGEGGHDGDRDRQGDGHRVAGVAKEEEEDREGQRSPQDQRLDHVADRFVDEGGLVGRDLDGELGVLRPEQVEGLLHQLGRRRPCWPPIP